jgi:Phospholipase_D-nuclease N-terminal
MLALDIVYVFLGLILIVPWWWVLYDAVRWAGGVWARAGRSKVGWVLFILLLPPFGVLAYLILTRPELVAVEGSSESVRVEARQAGTEVNPLLLMRRNTVVAIGLLLTAIALAGILGVLRLWRLA